MLNITFITGRNGIGKTHLARTITQMFPKHKVLIISHSYDEGIKKMWKNLDFYDVILIDEAKKNITRKLESLIVSYNFHLIDPVYGTDTGILKNLNLLICSQDDTIAMYLQKYYENGKNNRYTINHINLKSCTLPKK